MLNFYRLPWFQWPIIYEIRARPKMMTSPTGSKDLQMVNIGLRVLHRPETGNLPSMYRQLGLDYDDRVLPSICNEVIMFYRRDLQRCIMYLVTLAQYLCIIIIYKTLIDSYFVFFRFLNQL